MFLGQLREAAEKNNADINAGDFNASAHHERGKAKLSSIEEATAALVPNVEAWAAAVSLVAQGTLVMPEEVFLAASTSASAGQWQANDRPTPKDTSGPGWRCHRRPKYRQPSRYRLRRPCHPASLLLLGGRLVHTHMQAEHRERDGKALMGNAAAHRRCGKARRLTGRRTVERHVLSDRTALLCCARVRNSRALIRSTPSA